MIPNRIFVKPRGLTTLIGGPDRTKDTDVEFIRVDELKRILGSVDYNDVPADDDAVSFGNGFWAAVEAIEKKIEAL